MQQVQQILRLLKQNYRRVLPLFVLLLVFFLIFFAFFISQQPHKTPTSSHVVTPGSTPSVTPVGSMPFVTRVGSTLYLNGKPFRFAGTNIHWTGLLDAGGGQYPTTSSVDQAYADANAMHATVIREMTDGVSLGCPNCIEPSPNNFNDAAFVPIDYALKEAATYHMHVIIPLAADGNEYFNGGVSTFSNWLGISPEQVYTDQTGIQADEAYIAHILNHVNQYTGIAYKDDPTIMDWEIGNECANAPDSWAETIAKYIKSIDPNHLVSDCRQANSSHNFTTSQLQLPDIDMYTGHYYFDSFSSYGQDVRDAANLASQYNKAFFIGEWDWTRSSGSISDLQSFLTTLQGLNGLAGDTFWQLYPQGLRGDKYSLVYPGQNANIRQRAQILTQHASAMNGG
jgi:mannan endo-1,4-beta-mannosidase